MGELHAKILFSMPTSHPCRVRTALVLMLALCLFVCLLVVVRVCVCDTSVRLEMLCACVCVCVCTVLINLAMSHPVCNDLVRLVFTFASWAQCACPPGIVLFALYGENTKLREPR